MDVINKSRERVGEKTDHWKLPLMLMIDFKEELWLSLSTTSAIERL